MKMTLGGVAVWFCSQCGHGWRVRRENAPPERCPLCRSRGWQRDRDDSGELPGAD